MDREEEAEALRRQIDQRGASIPRYPEGHPARELYLAEAAEAAGRIEKLKGPDPSTRAFGILMTLAGGVLTVSALTASLAPWTLWAGLITTTLGALVTIGA